MRRVVITGLGTVNALGPNLETFWPRLLEGRSGVKPIRHFDASGHATQFGATAEWEPERHFPTPEFRKLEPFTMLALVAADEALRDAELSILELSEEERQRVGCIIGTGIGGIPGIEEQHLVLLERGPRRITPHFIPKIMANAVSGQVAIRHGILGTTFTTSSACASSGHAIGMALLSIRSGEADVIVTGGSESAITPLAIAGFNSAKALSTRNDDPAAASRPFDRDRDGFVMGEGAGLLVFEELERARARGARIYAEVKGYGSTDDAFHITAPKEDGEGPARAMRLAMRTGGVDPSTVDYVNAHGTSTKFNDVIETRAIKAALGDQASRVAISSTKSMLGHILGGSSAVELVATALSVHHGVVHPTINLTTPDPECDLDYVPNESRELEIRNALSNSLGFGGHNVSISIGRVD
jgi:3-oxoacyl-[acyl-carrier-protein] synthase II